MQGPASSFSGHIEINTFRDTINIVIITKTTVNALLFDNLSWLKDSGNTCVYITA